MSFCSHAAAQHAVLNWHYSRRMPVGKLVKVGVWEHGRFVGTVIFGRGAASHIGDRFGLTQRRVCELVRVALAPHATPTTRIVSLALRQLARQSPGLRLVVSYADEAAGHKGTLYRAGNWAYLGTVATSAYRVAGKLVHGRTLGIRYGPGGQSVPWLRANIDPAAARVPLPPKHKFIYPLAAAWRERLGRLAVQRAGSAAGGTPPDQGGRGGSTPTSALRQSPAAPKGAARRSSAATRTQADQRAHPSAQTVRPTFTTSSSVAAGRRATPRASRGPLHNPLCPPQASAAARSPASAAQTAELKGLTSRAHLMSQSAHLMSQTSISGGFVGHLLPPYSSRTAARKPPNS